MNDTQKKPNKDNECLSEITENQEDTLNEMNNNDIDNYEDQDELNKYLDKQNKISLNQFNH